MFAGHGPNDGSSLQEVKGLKSCPNHSTGSLSEKWTYTSRGRTLLVYSMFMKVSGLGDLVEWESLKPPAHHRLDCGRSALSEGREEAIKYVGGRVVSKREPCAKQTTFVRANTAKLQTTC